MKASRLTMSLVAGVATATAVALVAAGAAGSPRPRPTISALGEAGEGEEPVSNDDLGSLSCPSGDAIMQFHGDSPTPSGYATVEAALENFVSESYFDAIHDGIEETHRSPDGAVFGYASDAGQQLMVIYVESGGDGYSSSGYSICSSLHKDLVELADKVPTE